jgi:hypothetical protein
LNLASVKQAESFGCQTLLIEAPLVLFLNLWENPCCVKYGSSLEKCHLYLATNHEETTETGSQYTGVEPPSNKLYKTVFSRHSKQRFSTLPKWYWLQHLALL